MNPVIPLRTGIRRLATGAVGQSRALHTKTGSFRLGSSCVSPRRPIVRLADKGRIGWLGLAKRKFHTTPTVAHGHITPPKPGEELWVTFIDKEGDEHKIAVSEGDNLLDIAQDNELEMEGACGGSCACSTCHVIVTDEAYFDKMDEPSDDENDMLDLAFGLTETSRLGCQVKMTKELDGLKVKLPAMTRNLQASDFSS
ncbi:2Fe-2S iron-sulfur cluster binding domain-containing protein [Sodiomyces alkalinus F11]|uniref:2Fe-2S iron-sulfur cluster binding domain-containing protein n=1 Tax=Sodiomyces alkalinus (strain CBS 110278 / VKM F-3762 / F11) TaxID=1314773 RepID=A0A3N2PX11_SODAK|nr:2Fe-2S iron-sulfur cluster binding domain-containing protein [Sodiomyces alkalinus F11]ROT39060.1 2Fe-2S iron-sulfur cluster binding domain-containing protein [Sodiomyces alkalinus F11]